VQNGGVFVESIAKGTRFDKVEKNETELI